MKKTNRIIIFVIILILFILGLSLTKTNFTNNNDKSSPELSGTFVDERDQKTYGWVKIGDQTWMTENLAYKPESGFSIYEDNEDNLNTYGYLYDWQTAQNIAPEGWHLPSKEEWETLYKSLGVHPTGPLKEKGTVHWLAPNAEATNSTQFTALPGGGNFDGEYLMMGRKGFFWSTTEIDDTNAYALTIEHDNAGVSWYSGTKVRGLSVRCIKD